MKNEVLTLNIVPIYAIDTNYMNPILGTWPYAIRYSFKVLDQEVVPGLKSL